jgi:hypothetical protein
VDALRTTAGDEGAAADIGRKGRGRPEIRRESRLGQVGRQQRRGQTSGLEQQTSSWAEVRRDVKMGIGGRWLIGVAGCGLRWRGLLNLAGRGDEALHHRADDDVAA